MMKNGVYFIVKALLVAEFIQDLNLCIKMRCLVMSLKMFSR